MFLFSVLALFPGTASAEQPKQMKAVFSKDYTTQLTLDIEAALARAQAKLGIIPQSAADEITKKADIRYIPPKAVAEERKKVGHPLVCILNVWAKAMEGDAGEYIHYGATTSDIHDTTFVLQLRAAARIILNDLREIEAILMDLARKNKNTPMVGRTLGQHALPITFGLKVAKWAAENRRNIERLKDCMKRLNSGILTGAVDSYAGLGDKGFQTEELLMTELGLGAPEPVGWHGDRDNFAEFANTMTMIGMTFGKIGINLFLLQSTDIGEVEERLPPTAVGSSTMPQKRNPRKPRTLILASRDIRRHAEVIQDWMVSIFERDQISSDAQLKEICLKTDKLLKAAKPLLRDLVVKPDVMLANLNKTKGLIMSEKMMFVLGEKIGKHTAHHTTREIAMKAFEKDITLKEALLMHPDVTQHLSQEELDDMLDPTTYTGLSAQAVDRTLEQIKKLRQTDQL